MSDGAVIYGATGHMGKLLAARAHEVGMRPVLAGRDCERVHRLAARYGLEWRAAVVERPDSLIAALDGARVVLNAAGPFSATADAMVDACLRRGVHYLDLSGETLGVQRLTRRHAEARRLRTMLMPAVGFDVVATDCLAAHVKRRLPRARRLALAITPPGGVSAGSAKTLAENIAVGLVRSGARLQPLPIASQRRWFDYGQGRRRSVNISLADIVTAYYTTGIPDITTYVQVSPLLEATLAICRTAGTALSDPLWQKLLASLASFVPAPAPSGGHGRMLVVVEAEGARGGHAVSRLQTGEPYGFSAYSAIEITRRVLAGDLEAGFQTPGRVYGPDFVLGLPGVTRRDPI